ncbi:MAG: FkbM family methyltransferase [Bacteroidota bacterium]|nr:FkbM family methyltransferase [Bacteroidota bacterium]
MINKLKTFARYLKDFIRHGQFSFIYSAVLYELTGHTRNVDKLYKSSLGYFYTRGGTLDFQFANEAYEWSVKKFVFSHYKNYDYFIDIGANIGTYSILLANKGLKVISFEPVNDNYRVFRINLLLNKLQSKITTYNIALGEKDTDANFIFDPINTGASHIAKKSDSDDNTTTVHISTFDSLLPELNIPIEAKIMIKIDVEGMEIEVLNGAKKFLQSYPNLLLFMESKHSEENNIREKLDTLGDFEYLRVDNYNMASKKTII